MKHGKRIGARLVALETSYQIRQKETLKRLIQKERMEKINKAKHINDLVRHSTTFYAYQDHLVRPDEGFDLYNCLLCGSTIADEHRTKHYLTYHSHDLKEYVIK